MEQLGDQTGFKHFLGESSPSAFGPSSPPPSFGKGGGGGDGHPQLICLPGVDNWEGVKEVPLPLGGCEGKVENRNGLAPPELPALVFPALGERERERRLAAQLLLRKCFLLL